jgi:outer membrane receptor protein involved in Fe transport
MDGATVLNNHSRISRAGKRQYHRWLFSGTSLEINLFQRFVFILLLWAPQTSFSNNDKENTKHSVPEISQSVAVPDSSNSPVVSLDTSTVPVLPSVETDLQEADDSEEVPVYVLEDFVVTTEQDRGYYSANALAGTRTNQALKDTPMTVSVINQQLIEDLNLSLMDDIGAAMAGVEEEGESFSNNILRLRSFQVRNQLFEFFPRSAALNFYNIERVEVIRGANSLVYGQASPGGKANMLPKKALFENDKLKVETEQGENGYSRTTVDANYQINDKVAVRLMGVTLQSEFDQRYKLFEFDGATAAVTFRPNQRTSLQSACFPAILMRHRTRQ